MANNNDDRMTTDTIVNRIDELRVVEMVRSITTQQPAFQLDVPKLLLLCALEYQSRDKPTMTEAEVRAARGCLSKAERDALEARAKRAIAAAISAGLLGVTNLGRVGLRDQPAQDQCN